MVRYSGILAAVFVICANSPAFGDTRENTEVRQKLADFIQAPLSEVVSARRTVLAQRSQPHRVAVEVTNTSSAVYLLFVNESFGSFRLYSEGSWIIKRDRRNGAFIQAKVFFRADDESFVRIFPRRGGSVMDVYLYGRRLYDNVPLGLGFPQVLTSSFADLASMTRGVVDWDLLTARPDPTAYRGIRAMVDKIRPALAGLRDAEDGAMDADGRLVFIKDLRLQDALPGLNCSGFVKWVADGIHGPATGRFLDIDVLKARDPSRRGTSLGLRFDRTRDPYFGLDWSRNIAAALGRLDDPLAPPQRFDVERIPWHTYRDDIGFPMEELGSLAFSLAVREPGFFYIGSVNRPFGTNPTLQQHVHMVALFPFFDDDGDFRLVVMERNVESSLASLLTRYPNDFIHLVRVRAKEGFLPPVFRQ